VPNQQIITILNRLVTHYGHQKWWSSDNKLADLVTMILIQQTTSKNVEKAMDNLQPYLTLEKLDELPIEDLQVIIRPAGFFKQKSSYLKNVVAWLRTYQGDFTTINQLETDVLRKELLSLKGIGPETADVILLYLFNRQVFIADQYALRLFQRLGYNEYQTYAQLQKVMNPIASQVSLLTCKEWHAVIDEHGKVFGKNKQLDESWLLA
jgi:endonuclease-3 related protein